MFDLNRNELRLWLITLSWKISKLKIIRYGCLLKRGRKAKTRKWRRVWLRAADRKKMVKGVAKMRSKSRKARRWSWSAGVRAATSLYTAFAALRAGD